MEITQEADFQQNAGWKQISMFLSLILYIGICCYVQNLVTMVILATTM